MASKALGNMELAPKETLGLDAAPLKSFLKSRIMGGPLPEPPKLGLIQPGA